MSSTYSPDLRLELIGTGDQAGVWGSTTNNTLGTLMEAAIAGYTSVAIIASPQALTALDGATDQARYNSIALTTTTGANFVVCTPPTPKLYTFYNTTAYTATITNATAKNGTTPTGGTTVIIPAGKTMSVWTDGSNFAQQTDHLISPTLATPTLASPTLTGTPVAPTAAYGTNTTQLATTAFVQAALQALYPVGSIYSSTVSTNPGTLFGFGTWVAYAAGRVLIGNGGGFSAGATGGSADAITVDHTHTFGATTGTESASHSHAISINDPGHSHTYLKWGVGGSQSNQYTNYDNGFAQTSPSFTGVTASAGTQSANHTHSVSGTTNSTGSSGTNANLQPYVVVYMWNRTA